MSGFTLFLVMLCLLQNADAQITGWTETSFSSVSGAGTATISATVTSKVPENSIAGAKLFNAVATKTGSGAIVYIIASGNTGSLFEIDTAGAVKLATGKSLDFETTPSYTLQITASETGATGATGTATLTVSIKNVLEFGQTKYDVNMTCGATADTTVGTYIVMDNTASTTVTYAITSGNINSDFTFNATGVLKVATGKTLSQKTTEKYTMVLLATESGAVADAGSTTVLITVGTCGCSALAATLGLTLVAVVIAVST
ncbi:protocadherin Fat 2-like [Dreissena polymorpha]|uniref:protocadherin Fat 2-like n=1 Tax=Dreissena polymorpha TaxID=45954 RepID=UPI002264F195|nr:protocadherin Fat 2-like [Dreissena polymorpha]